MNKLIDTIATLDTKSPYTGRVFSIASDRDDVAITDAQIHPTANTTVGTDSSYLLCWYREILGHQSRHRAADNALTAGLAN
ncbi:hypothetical protein ES703_78193 [subsurface metagenome]